MHSALGPNPYAPSTRTPSTPAMGAALPASASSPIVPQMVTSSAWGQVSALRWIAVALGMGLLLGVVVLLSMRPSVDPNDARSAAEIDPGPEAHADVRQQTLQLAATERLAAGDAETARDLLDRSIEIAPTSPHAFEAMLLRAKAHHALGEDHRARADLEEVVRRTPADNLFHLEAQERLVNEFGDAAGR